MRQFDSICASAEEGVSGLEQVNNFQCVQELLEVQFGFHLLVPGTLPLHFHIITLLSQGLLFLKGGFVEFL